MNLDAELTTNLSGKKSQVAYSEPKQDAKLPSKITDLTNTQTRGLCQDKKSDPESLADHQGINKVINHPIAATDSSQNQWQIPTSIKLDSSGLWQPSKTEVLATTIDYGLICKNNPKWGLVSVASGPDAHLSHLSCCFSCNSDMFTKYGTLGSFFVLSCVLCSICSSQYCQNHNSDYTCQAVM
jgi:hypothetical protein